MSTAQPPLKKLRADVADAESNTTNSGELKLFVTIYLLRAMGKREKGLRKIDKQQGETFMNSNDVQQMNFSVDFSF
jgi:hypothetical protein